MALLMHGTALRCVVSWTWRVLGLGVHPSAARGTGLTCAAYRILAKASMLDIRTTKPTAIQGQGVANACVLSGIGAASFCSAMSAYCIKRAATPGLVPVPSLHTSCRLMTCKRVYLGTLARRHETLYLLSIAVHPAVHSTKLPSALAANSSAQTARLSSAAAA